MTEAEFLEIACRNGANRTILERLPELELNDAWLVSGSLFQTVWNVLTDRPLGHGIKDYDIFYFDPTPRGRQKTRDQKSRRALCRSGGRD